MKIGFDNEKYILMQSEHIKERISHFGDKLYLEIGGKLFDDYHASRVLPGFKPDSKLQMLLQLKDQAEVVVAINAEDIEANKIRADYGITYDEDVIRLIKEFRSIGLYVSSVCLTKYLKTPLIDRFEERLHDINIKTYHHFRIEGYPTKVEHIVSDEGYGLNDFIITTKPLVVVTAPGPGSGKLATCLSQLYHEHKNGVQAGYAKFETFPIWSIPLKHPVNLAYEAATADLNDVNLIDSFHLEAYGETAVNYNRDIEAFPVLKATFDMIYGSSPYQSPTDMGVNMAGFCIVDDAVCVEASKQEIIRRYYKAIAEKKTTGECKDDINKLENLMRQLSITELNRKVVAATRKVMPKKGKAVAAIELDDGTILTGKTTELLGPSAAVLLKSLKYLADIPEELNVISPDAIKPIQELKTKYLGSKNPRLHTDEVLIALSASAAFNEDSKKALDMLTHLNGCQIHSSVLLSNTDINTFKKLGLQLTMDPVYE